MKWIFSGLAFIALVLLAPAMWVFFSAPTPPDTSTGLPWQVETPSPGQSRVFGLQPGAASVADAIGRFGREFEVAIIASPGQAPALEGYFESTRAGPITGKAVIAILADAAEIDAMMARAAKVEYMESTTRKYTLHAEDLGTIKARTVRAITFIPSAHLDEDVILQRFGNPAQRIRAGETLEHFLYPDKGLDLALDSKGKEVLQYVAPAEFERLRKPLLEHAATTAAQPAAAATPAAAVAVPAASPGQVQ